jgi:hypothetical protein
MFINISSTNTTQSAIPIEGTISLTEQSSIDTKETEVAIDRFNLHRCVLPIYQSTTGMTVRFQANHVGAAPYSVDVDTSPYHDINGFIYSLDRLATCINTALTSAATAGSFTNIPVISINRAGIATLTYSANPDFKLFFSSKLYKIFSSFPYIGDLPTDQYFRLDLTGTSITTARVVSPSPVDKIQFKTTGLPVIPEILPSVVPGMEFSDELLTDFNVGGENIEMCNDLFYSATDGGMYRYHDMTPAILKKFTINVYFTTFSGGSYRCLLMTGGSFNIKLHIHRKA